MKVRIPESRHQADLGALRRGGGRLAGMSPTIFLPREEERLHVHVQGERGEAKFWLEPAIELAVNWGLSDRMMKSAMRLIHEHEAEIRAAWKKPFDR